MDNLKRLFFLSLLAFIFGWVPTQKIYASSKTIIYGNIKNMDVYPDTKEVSIQIADFGERKTIYRDSIKSDGKFKIEFDLQIAQDIYVEPLVGIIIAHPGDIIQIDIDFKDIGNIRFFGNGAKTNQDLNFYLNSNYSLGEYKNPITENGTPESFSINCDSVKNQMIEKWKQYNIDKKPNKEAQKWTYDLINIKYYKALLNFPFIYSYKKNMGSDWSPSTSYYRFIDNVSTIFDNSTLNTEAYSLLWPYCVTFSKQNIKGNSNDIDSIETIILSKISQGSFSNVFKQLLIGRIFYQKLKENNIEFLEFNRVFIDDMIKEPFIKVPLEIYYHKIKAEMGNPQIVSDAIFSRMYNTSGKKILDSIIKDNIGKVIYIDFWATWCGPCIAEFPNSKKMIQKYIGKDVVFVFICLGADEKKANSIFTEFQLKEKNYYCTEEQGNSISKGLGINAIPHYILIDKQGHITDQGSYLRPIYTETIKRVDKLLNEK